MNWSEFFHMGGYAFEVWTCWGLTLAVLVTFVIYPKRRSANIRSQILREISREKIDQENAV